MALTKYWTVVSWMVISCWAWNYIASSNSQFGFSVKKVKLDFILYCFRTSLQLVHVSKDWGSRSLEPWTSQTWVPQVEGSLSVLIFNDFWRQKSYLYICILYMDIAYSPKDRQMGLSFPCCCRISKSLNGYFSNDCNFSWIRIDSWLQYQFSLSTSVIEKAEN